MGKVAYRRKNRRIKRFREMSQRDPEMFSTEWSKRLVSWQNEAKSRANQLIGDNGNQVPEAFIIIEMAMNELAAIGPKALELEGLHTEEILNEACCLAVARACDWNLRYRSNGYSNYIKMAKGYHKPPRY